MTARLEALERYSFYGVEAEEVIAAMADQGLLVKRSRAKSLLRPIPGRSRPSFPPFVA